MSSLFLANLQLAVPKESTLVDYANTQLAV